MASRDPDQLVVAGSGDIWIAPVGTALPTTEAASLNGLFERLGYTTEDGVTFNFSTEIEEFGAWQSRSPVRRELIAQSTTLSFVLSQWNDSNFIFALGGGEITEVTSGHYELTMPADDDALVEKCLIVDVVDGAKNYRFVVERGTVTEAVEVNMTRTALATLPVGFKALAPDGGGSGVSLLTNDPAFSPVAS